MAWFKKQKSSRSSAAVRPKTSEGLWLKCNHCREIIYRKEVDRNHKVCPKCAYHFPLLIPERIALLADNGTFKEWDADLEPLDPLTFLERPIIIEEGDAAVVYSGDTYETEALWRAAARVPNLKAAFIEVSFPDALTELARVSAHLTPRLFAQEFKKIGRPDLPVYAYHIKPRFRKTITEELGRLDIPNVRVLEEGQELVL